MEAAAEVANTDTVHPEVRAQINSLVSAVRPLAVLLLLVFKTDPLPCACSSVDSASTMTKATSSATTPSTSCAI